MLYKIFAFALLAILLGGCGDDKGEQGALTAPVRVAIVEKTKLNKGARAVGNVAASASVAIVPRVTGEIVDVRFKEGQEVSEGQPLVIIDPRPYEADLREKQGQLFKSEAQLAKALDDRRRYGKLVGNGYVSREAFDQTATDAAALRATVQSDRAAVERAALDLEYCTVRAPISGRVGALSLHKGNMVKSADSSPIAHIDTISPCYVHMSLPEANLPSILRDMKRGPIPITATPAGGRPEEGVLTLVDNNVDTRTGTIKLRGVFKNEDRNLWPGQFVEARLPVGETREALMVPSEAVQPGREGKYVYVITPEGKAKYTAARVVFETEGKSAIEGDIKEGDKVVIDGQVRLAPDMPVTIVE